VKDSYHMAGLEPGCMPVSILDNVIDRKYDVIVPDVRVRLQSEACRKWKGEKMQMTPTSLVVP
jgi:hypothetical protein